MSRIIQGLNKFEEGLVGFSLLGLAILTCVETLLRYAVNYTFTWFQEFSNYMIVFTTFLGASLGVKYGTHFSMDALVQYVPDRACHALKSIAYFISGIVLILFVVYGTHHLLRLKGFGVKSAAMQIPMFIPYIPIPLFSITMAFRFFALSVEHFRSFLKGEPFEKVRRRD